MKLKYSIVSLLALAATLVSCEKEADHYLSEIQVSSSYVSLPKTGGDATITVTAEGPWEVTKITDEAFKTDLEWLTVTPKSGVAGETTVKFHADAPDAAGPVEHIRVRGLVAAGGGAAIRLHSTRSTLRALRIRETDAAFSAQALAAVSGGDAPPLL